MNNSGYSTTYVGSRSDGTRRSIGRHVLAYETAYGPVPAGLVVHHECHNRRCLEPTHLRAVTNSENLRMRHPGWIHWTSRITECPKGHPYDEENTRVGKEGRRHCRECGRQANRENYIRKKQLLAVL